MNLYSLSQMKLLIHKPLSLITKTRIRDLDAFKTGSLPGPADRLTYSAVRASPLPANYRSALADPNWRAAMEDEYKALIDNGTWRLVPRPPGANVVSGKWIFKHKYNSDGSLARHKARWVIRGFSQQYASTTTRRSVRLSNWPLFGSSSASPLLALGLYTSWT